MGTLILPPQNIAAQFHKICTKHFGVTPENNPLALIVEYVENDKYFGAVYSYEDSEVIPNDDEIGTSYKITSGEIVSSWHYFKIAINKIDGTIIQQTK